MPLAPIDLLAAVAVEVETVTGIKSVAVRAPSSWRTGTDPYVVVTEVSPVASELRGDGTTIRDVVDVQVSLYERSGADDPARVIAIIDALEGKRPNALADVGSGDVTGWRLVPSPDDDDVHHAIEVAYRARR